MSDTKGALVADDPILIFKMTGDTSIRVLQCAVNTNGS